MKDSVVTIEKDYFFKQHNHVHIHLSDECKDYIAVLHKHKFIEVVYILSGKAKHIMEQKEYFVKKGDVSYKTMNYERYITSIVPNDDFDI